MRTFNLTGLFLFLFLCVACSNKNKKVEGNVPVSIIDYASIAKSNLNDFERLKECEYILFNDSGKVAFGEIDKIKVTNKRIYIADGRMDVLAVYDRNGVGLGTVGVHGQGPNEFINITDFDVDSLGNVALLDGRLDKVLLYDSAFRFTREYKLPFEVDVLQFLKDGNMMMGLSSWNRGEHEGEKIVVVDRNMKVINSFFTYDEYVDPGYWISDYMFAKSSEGIAYNQTINDDIYVFTHSGDLKEVIHFDFGSETVPDKSKKDIEANLMDFDDYCLLSKIYQATDHYIIGTLWDHRKTKMFVLDRMSNICHLGAPVEKTDGHFLCGVCDQGFISQLIEPDESYPDSVNCHLEKEGTVLRITSMN